MRGRRLNRTVLGRALILVLATLTIPAPCLAQEQADRPLVMAGKRSLYQRVLTRPGAALRADIEQAAGTPVAPFTVYYVYERRVADGRDWLHVGSDSHGNIVGWLPAGESIEWMQTLTVAFKEPLTHNRVLLFRDRESVKQILDDYDIVAYRRLRRTAEQGIGGDSPVIAIQPQAHVDIHEDFYLVPILSHEDVFVGEKQALLLQVATVPLEEKRPAARENTYRSGIVFVTDTTTSMGPYIDHTRETVRRVFQTIEAAGLGEKVGFGLVAYRDNTTVVPGLEYVTRTYADLTQGLSWERFIDKVNGVKPATVSSKGFDEDAFAGIKAAIERIDWSGYNARYVILVTDAGPRLSNDPLSATGLDAESLRQLARDKGITIWVMHLLTPQGAKDHEFAADQYRRVSQFSGVGDFYYAVPAGAVADFSVALGAMAAQLTDQVRDTARGIPPIPQPGEAAAETPLEEFQQKVAKLGYALRMRYLQRLAGSTIPTLFSAWLLDCDFEDPNQRALEVRALLTRDQLSDLQYVLKRVLETAELGMFSPRNFINDLKSLAASISRDPTAASISTQAVGGANLADLGYMREYIEGLPYRGEVMSLDLETWEQWSAKRQIEFTNRLESKINYYQAVHDNLDLWISLDGGPVTADSVYPLLLETLP